MSTIPTSTPMPTVPRFAHEVGVTTGRVEQEAQHNIGKDEQHVQHDSSRIEQEVQHNIGKDEQNTQHAIGRFLNRVF